MEKSKLDTNQFNEALTGERAYFSQSVNGTGQVRNAKTGAVNFFINLKSDGALVINRENVYDSNRSLVFEAKIQSIESLIKITNEKCGLK